MSLQKPKAINHPTFATGGATYQRLEFLGDGEYLRLERIKVSRLTNLFLEAIIDLIVLHHVFEKPV